MGTSSGGIAIRMDTSKVDLLTIVTDLFGNGFTKSESYCDTRNKDCFYLAKTKDFLVITNSDLADKFFQDQNTERIQEYLDYFSKPDFVFAFEEYDSGGTYSYSLIYDGIVKRQFRSLSYETTIDYGEPEPTELKWKNAETILEDIGDGEFEMLYKDSMGDFSFTAAELPAIMLEELMNEKLGFVNSNMDEHIIEDGVFQKNIIG